ncbi:primase alpha helix C-terminal domain-containing protein, partial [Escherichia coli]|nr:primase alpha helix C-terminal domain-containing protein [Escherichia coli]EKL9025613.1 primase alpha helix C-terminal domain-containing protein [Escherichia coli]EKM3658528.1 primase alpha helix C-terminal domain-containing protein [Escherichia coli]EKM3672834.1 primase alpha helix C-terminal domain-containing protein [Escherichia coli]
RRRVDKDYGMGRNCHLFEMTRKWAYRAIRQGWPAFSQWLDAVIQRVEMYNASLPVPLSPAECRAIGKSIAKYTYRKFSPEGFSAVQAARGRKGGNANSSENQAIKGQKSKRVAVATSARTLKPWVTLGISRATYYRKLKCDPDLAK